MNVRWKILGLQCRFLGASGIVRGRGRSILKIMTIVMILSQDDSAGGVTILTPSRIIRAGLLKCHYRSLRNGTDNTDKSAAHDPSPQPHSCKTDPCQYPKTHLIGG
jgi:hypothetical protein